LPLVRLLLGFLKESVEELWGPRSGASASVAGCFGAGKFLAEATARTERLSKGFATGLAEWLLIAALFTPAGNFSWCCSLHGVTMADISQSASILEL
jgi:hypothetical protein